MAQVILSAVGSAIGGPVGGSIGRTVGGLLDREAISALTPARQVGRRLSGLQLNSTAEGAPMAAAFGRARVAGQVIWAARFKERRVAVATGGGRAAPRPTATGIRCPSPWRSARGRSTGWGGSGRTARRWT